jgi:hypothetical protein
MSSPYDPPRLVTARRDFLRLAVLAPVAIAGCATSGASSRGDPGAPGAAAKRDGGSGAAEQGPSAADAIRAVPLGMDVEPAFVFRAGRGE